MKTGNLVLNEQKLQALLGLIDAGIRATGIRSVKDAAVLIADLEAVQAEMNKEEPDND